MAVRAELGPTLPALLAARGVSRRGMALGLAALVVLGGLLVLAARALSDQEKVVVDGPPQFNLVYAQDVLHRVDPRPGEVLRLEGARRRIRVSIAARPVTFPPTPATDLVGGYLPILAERREDQLRRRYEDLGIADEGKANVNRNPGYQIGFTGRRGGIRILGRDVYLVPDEHGARRGILLSLRQRRTGRLRPADRDFLDAAREALSSFNFGSGRP